MALLYSIELTGSASTPRTVPNGAFVGGRLRRYRATLTLATQTTSDYVLLATQRTGDAFAFGIITASATLGGTAEVAIGTNATHASNGQFRASATFTSANTPTLFGLASAVSQAQVSAPTPIYMTIGAASLPGSGTVVVDLYFCNG